MKDYKWHTFIIVIFPLKNGHECYAASNIISAANATGVL